jgi:hypothetical protein
MKTGIQKEFELVTRNHFTKINAVVSMTVDGKELPNMAILGEALEKAINLIQKKIQQSYEVVPARI